ncbi:Nucleotide-binding universal stress protein, UspA family [Arthrobacter sp. cf158]|uniref:universal stress protein n=1 Tax=Arthrobacter sp. cf158 TaxID=1761744 RepID=UPI0008972D51|nr:universal stress protein [Arthrobacter sp. cf158]SDW61185.1 Nucleotide-binding universal stress protein, UspA family [Arthrobacter sp. cf158]
MTGAIIVGVDGSVTAKSAADAARDLALSLGAALHVVTAYDDDGTIVFGTGSDHRVASHEANAEKTVQKAAAELSSANLKVTYAAVRGTATQVLLDEARRVEARMIVVGNKGMHGLGRVLGSVASSVAHNAPCDVYIAKTAG